AMAVLTKYVPAMIVPWLIRRRAWLLLGVAAAAAAILAAPFLGAGPALTTGLRIYARHWEFNGALYHLLREAIDSDLQIRYILAGAGVVATLAWRLKRAARAKRQDRAWACTSESTPT